MARIHTPAVLTDKDGVPVVQVKRGDLDSRVFSKGELRAVQTAILAAPPVGGGALQISQLARTGTVAKKGDVVIEFDPAEQEYVMEQSRSEMMQAEQEIIKAKAEAAVQAAKDKVELLKAQFAVRRAELEVSKNELVSSIDANKNLLALDQAKRVLAQLEHDTKSHSALNESTLALAREKQNKSQLAMTVARQNIEKMHVTSPMDGIVAIERNLDSNGGMMWPGMVVPNYRQGDQAQPGRIIARIIDLTEMEMTATVSERQRATVSVGQPAEIRFYALPGITFHGKVKAVGDMSTHDLWSIENGGSYTLTVQLSGADPRLRSGFTGEITLEGEPRKNVLYVPRQALFSKDGKRIVYLKNNGKFQAHAVTVKAENESRAAIEGVSDGDIVAIANPEIPRKAASATNTAPIAGGRP